MSEQENIATMKNGYEAFARGDLDTVLGVLADDSVWTIPGNSKIGGTYKGKDQVVALLGQLAEKGFANNPDTWLAADDRVVVLTTTTTDGRSSRQVDIWKLRGGQAYEYESVSDTKLLEEIWGTK